MRRATTAQEADLGPVEAWVHGLPLYAMPDWQQGDAWGWGEERRPTHQGCGAPK